MSADWARPVVHWHLEAENLDAQRAFYSAMFQWDIAQGPIANVPAGIGGPEPGPGGHLQAGPSKGLTLYIQVRSLAESLEKAAALGGAVTFPAFDVPDGPTIAGITDPEGNPLVLVQQ